MQLLLAMLPALLMGLMSGGGGGGGGGQSNPYNQNPYNPHLPIAGLTSILNFCHGMNCGRSDYSLNGLNPN